MLYYCECGTIFDVCHNLYSKDEIDWTNLGSIKGLFINASRIKEKIFDFKEELKKLIGEMDRTIETMKRAASINEQWAKGSWNTLETSKTRLQDILGECSPP